MVNSAVGRPELEAPEEGRGSEAKEAFFLSFFTHLNLTTAAVEALGTTGFSLTKHRVLGFATLTPGMTVGELVRALRVTHQNLNEPLRSLINDGYVVAKIGESDRRHKRLFATAKGARIYRRVLAQQMSLLEDAFRAAGPAATQGFLEVHRHLVGADDRAWIDRASGAAGGENLP